MKPISLSDHAGYKAADHKEQELRTKRDTVARQLQEATALLHVTPDADDEVQAELEGRAITSTAVVTRDEIAQLHHRQRVLTEAIECQKKVVERAKYEASVEIRKRELPAYRAIVKRLSSVLAALRDVALEESEFRHAMIGGGVIYTDEFILPYGDTGERETDGVRYDSIARWEKRARDLGVI